MSRNWLRSLRAGCTVALAAAVLLAVGCSKKAPKEANDALAKAMTALTTGEKDAFVAVVLPDQREGVTGLAEWAFLQEAKSYEIDNDADLEVTDESAMIMVTLHPEEEKAFAHFYVVTKKVDGNWLIDLNESIKGERARNSVHAFQWYTFETKPG